MGKVDHQNRLREGKGRAAIQSVVRVWDLGRRADVSRQILTPRSYRSEAQSSLDTHDTLHCLHQEFLHACIHYSRRPRFSAPSLQIFRMHVHQQSWMQAREAHAMIM